MTGLTLGRRWLRGLLKRAQAEAEGETVESKKLIALKYGLSHVTYLIEQSNPQLVHDIDLVVVPSPVQEIGRSHTALLRENHTVDRIGIS